MNIAKVLLSFMIISLMACTEETRELPPSPLTAIKNQVAIQLLWKKQIGDGFGLNYTTLNPAIQNKTIFVATHNGDIASINRINGKQKWTKNLKTEITGAVGIFADVVSVATNKGSVVALNAKNGKILWSTKVNREVLVAPVVTDNYIFVQTQDDKILALDINTGKQLWSYEEYIPALTFRGTSKPVVSNSQIIFANSSGKIVSLDIATGEVQWSTRISVPKGTNELDRIIDIDGSLELHNNTVYLVGYQSKLAAIDATNGKIIWQRDASSINAPIYDNDTVFVSAFDGNVSAISNYNNTEEWNNNSLLRRKLSPGSVLGNYLIVGDYNGYLHFLNRDTGVIAGRVRIDEKAGIRAQPQVIDSIIYVYSNSGVLQAMRLK